ncbi:MAG: hypothetical protein RH917_02535 [Lacipirellulaceae bacterium]
MSEKKADELHWRETYFIVFPKDNRPSLDEVEHVLSDASPRFKLQNLAADDQGMFQSVLVESDEDHAAVEVSFELGESVIEQNLEFAKQMQDHVPSQQLQQLMQADARLDVAHFERCPAGTTTASSDRMKPPTPSLNLDEAYSDDAYADDPFGDDFGDGGEPDFEMLDPTCLLTVVDALASLTGGLTVDPAAGELV